MFVFDLRSSAGLSGIFFFPSSTFDGTLGDRRSVPNSLLFYKWLARILLGLGLPIIPYELDPGAPFQSQLVGCALQHSMLKHAACTKFPEMQRIDNIRGSQNVRNGTCVRRSMNWTLSTSFAWGGSNERTYGKPRQLE